MTPSEARPLRSRWRELAALQLSLKRLLPTVSRKVWIIKEQANRYYNTTLNMV